MRIFLAGATGVIGQRLLPLMVSAGHEVAAVTRTPEKVAAIGGPGVTAILLNIFDRNRLIAEAMNFRPDLIVHQVTDLPDEIERIMEFYVEQNRVRSEGTQNLLAAAQKSGASGFIAQSIAWPGGPVVEAHEEAVLSFGGTVLRYGQFYGPGTYYELEPPPAPRIHIDAAARRTMDSLLGPPGTQSIIEDE
jgi:hypothetical protein